MIHPDQDRFDQLFVEALDEIRSKARSMMYRESPGHTLEADAVVNEAYQILQNQTRVDWRGHRHVVAMSVKAMRWVLVKHARRKKAARRGGDRVRTTLSGLPDRRRFTRAEFVALDDALAKLASHLDSGPRMVQVVEQIYWNGLRPDEVAEVLSISRRTVERDWRYAKAFLEVELSGSEASS